MRRFLGQQLGAFVYKDPPVQIANHDLSESAAVFWTHTAGGNILVSGAGTGSVNNNYVESGTTAGKPSYTVPGTSLFIQWNAAAQNWQIGDGAYSRYFSDDDVATPDLVTTWEAYSGYGVLPVPSVSVPTTTYTDGAGNIVNVVDGATIDNFKIVGTRLALNPSVVYWGDSNTIEVSASGTLLNHIYPNSGPKDTPKFTEGVITETSNHYMNKTFIRGSSKVLEKLI